MFFYYICFHNSIVLYVHIFYSYAISVDEHTKEKNTQVLKLGGILDLTDHPFFDISNKPSVEVDFIPPPYNGAI